MPCGSYIALSRVSSVVILLRRTVIFTEAGIRVAFGCSIVRFGIFVLRLFLVLIIEIFIIFRLVISCSYIRRLFHIFNVIRSIFISGLSFLRRSIFVLGIVLIIRFLHAFLVFTILFVPVKLIVNVLIFHTKIGIIVIISVAVVSYHFFFLSEFLPIDIVILSYEPLYINLYHPFRSLRIIKIINRFGML